MYSTASDTCKHDFRLEALAFGAAFLNSSELGLSGARKGGCGHRPAICEQPLSCHYCTSGLQMSGSGLDLHRILVLQLLL